MHEDEKDELALQAAAASAFVAGVGVLVGVSAAITGPLAIAGIAAGAFAVRGLVRDALRGGTEGNADGE